MAASCAMLAVTAVDAQASTTYRPTGTTINLAKTSGLVAIGLTDIEAGQTWSCAQFGMGGSVVGSGASRAYGSAASALSGVSITGCSNPVMGWMTTTTSGSWSLDVVGDPTGTSYPARISGVQIAVGMANCDLTVSGSISGSFDTATQSFTPVSGASGLTINDIPGPTPGHPQTMCLTLDWLEGDTIAVGGSWTNTGPAVAIANP
ncbi:hypothetical protein DX116_04170 [Aeromicrobium endophyticum]|uniref:Uncharacterized protein n=2 Tax=Aeromicrobium endophyticum TaxID=2292704 RepID=A0A371PA32_9ACTN|nr:hypothetical protein DX116_04170 [Aeromicrobium endophyticum]